MMELLQAAGSGLSVVVLAVLVGLLLVLLAKP